MGHKEPSVKFELGLSQSSYSATLSKNAMCRKMHVIMSRRNGILHSDIPKFHQKLNYITFLDKIYGPIVQLSGPFPPLHPLRVRCRLG